MSIRTSRLFFRCSLVSGSPRRRKPFQIFGLSHDRRLKLSGDDAPAWYVARAQTLAEKNNWEPVAAIQLEYSLISRSLEREHLPMARELGISLVPWSPLTSGFLTGKFKKTASGIDGRGRVSEVKDSGNPVLEKFAKNERNWDILAVVKEVSSALSLTPATLALGWVLDQRGVTSTLIGATNLAQLESKMQALGQKIPHEALERFDQATGLETNELDHFFSDFMFELIHGGVAVKRKR